MREALDGVPVKDWDRPSNVVGVGVVVAPGAAGGYGSGLLPSALSPFSMNEWFVKGTEPRQVDDWYTAGCPRPDGQQSVAMRIRDGAPTAGR